jgi:xanthine dehydrogenase accessory factor
MNHSVALDRMCLGAALAAGTRPYVGLLGPVDRTRKIVDVLRETEGASDAAIERVRAPIGVPLGGEGPAAVALSIVAELEQTYARRVPTRRVSPPAADGARRGVSRR